MKPDDNRERIFFLLHKKYSPPHNSTFPCGTFLTNQLSKMRLYMFFFWFSSSHWKFLPIKAFLFNELNLLNYFLNLYFPFPWPDTGSIISACTKLERCFEAPDDHCFHQIIIACKRRFIIYNLCKKICDIFTRFPIKNLFLSWDNLP